MRSLLGRFRRTVNRSISEQLATLTSSGDGSTLSLDFTAMSSLDSRFTFSRSSPATFINSSGQVKYADHNLFVNTVWTSTTTPTGWGGPLLSGTVTWNGNGTVTMTASSQRPCIFATPAISISQGVTYAISYRIESISAGTPAINEIIASNSATDTYYRNGVVVAGSTTVSSGDTIGITFVAAGTTINPRLGPGVSSPVTCTMTISQPQFNAGSVLQTYLANSSTSSALQLARFDYDPTTLAPRGLLIEGSATNELTNSETFGTGWTDTNITRNSTNNTSPANDLTALRVTASAANATIIRSAAMGTIAQRTLSVWLRRVSGTGNIQFTTNNGTAWTTQAITSSWVRYTFTATTEAQQVGFRIVTSGDSIELWGAQLEASSTASSYIPTGASTVQRAADSCQLTGTNFSSWFNATQGTLFARGQRRLTSNTGMLISANDTTNSEAMGLGSSTTGRWLIRDGGSDVASISPGTVTANTTYRIAGAYAVNDAQAALNGTLGTADTSLTLPTVNQLDIGRDRVSVYLDGYVELIKYWPTRLPDAQLQAITA